jgi:hypothetical protein
MGDEAFCAEFHGGGSVHFGMAPPPPPPPRRAQVVIVHEEPPPPPVVVYQPAPPPPARVVVVTEVQPQPRPAPRYRLEPVRLGVGVHGRLGGMISDRVQMGGIAGAFRIRPNDGHLAVDLGVGIYGGQDYHGNDRVEVPLTADLLLYVNPQNRLQLYGVLGVGASFASIDDGGWRGTFDEDDMHSTYLGGQLGVGLELRLSRWFAINGDIRGFVRERVDSTSNRPEFTAADGRTTNTSGGAVGNIGATIYF